MFTGWQVQGRSLPARVSAQVQVSAPTVQVARTLDWLAFEALQDSFPFQLSLRLFSFTFCLSHSPFNFQSTLATEVGCRSSNFNLQDIHMYGWKRDASTGRIGLDWLCNTFAGSPAYNRRAPVESHGVF